MPTKGSFSNQRVRKLTASSLVLAAALFAGAGCSTMPAEADGTSAQAAPARTASRPNVVVILVDDLGWPDVSSYGRTDVLTPNIDRIAKSGVAFADGYVTASVCAVSRAGLLTGRMPQTFGFTYNINDDDGTPTSKGDVGAGLPTSEKTLAERLKPLGYRTAAIGKWHQGVEAQFYPTNRGFDEFFGFLAGESPYVDPKTPGIVTTPTKADHYAVDHRRPNAEVIEGPDRKVVHDFNRYLTYEITDHAVDFIDRSADSKKPFFAYVAYNAPHWPMQVPQEWYDKFPQIKDPVRRTYVAMIAAMDAGVGKILDALDTKGVRQNTMVVFLSDNGCPIQFGFCNSAHPWGWGKFTYLEGGVRVPFLMSWPARLKPQGIVTSPVSSLDITPTVLHAAAPGAPLPAGLDGVDLVQTVVHPPKTPRLLVWGQEPVYAARQGNYRFWESENWHTSYLADIGKDPWERTDVASEHPEVAAKLSGAIADWRKSLPTPRWKLHFTRPITVDGRKTEWVY